MSTTKFSGDQVLQQVYDPATDSLKTNLTANISGAQEVIISSTNDSIAIRNTGNSNELLINADGSINTVGASVVGGATSAKQDVGNASLASIDSKTPSLGQQLAAASSPVVLTASQISTLTPLSTVAVSNFPVTQPVSIAASVAVTGPLTDTQLRASAVPVSGTVTANAGTGTFAVSNVSLPLPAGASTEATLSALNTKVTTTANGIKVDGSAVTQPVSGTFFQATQPVSIAASVPVTGPLTDTQLRATALPVSGTFFQGTQPVSAASLPLPTSASTSALQTTGNSSLSSIDTKTPALGQALAASSVPIVLTASQLTTLTPLSTVAVTGTFFQATQPVSGTFFQATQPVSAASLPLPALAATSTKQSDGSQKTQHVDGAGLVYGPAIVSGNENSMPVAQSATNFVFSTVNSTTAQLAASATFTGTVESAVNQQSYSVLLFSDQPGTLNILQYIDAGGTKLIQTVTITNLANVPISRSGVINGNYIKVSYQNTGASTTTTLQLDTAYGTIPSATQLNNSPVSLNEINGTALSLGQTTMAASLPVTLASNQASIPVAATLSAETTKVIGTINVAAAQTITVTQATAANLNANITNITGTVSLPTGASTAANQTSTVGSLGAGTSATNSQLAGNVFTATLPTLTTGQQLASQADVNGRTLVAATPVDGAKVTYSASATALVPAAAATDMFTITGSATKTIRVLRIDISATQTTAGENTIVLLKRSTANTAGTSTAPTAVPHDSASAAGTATVLAYTANPTTGTLVGNLRSRKIAFQGATGTTSDVAVFDFGNRPGQAIVLRGVSQVLALNLNGATITGGSCAISVEWTEE